MSYTELKSYKQAAIIYDFTVEFCDRYVDMTYKSYPSYKTERSYKSYSRMSDQMIQAARSGKQNIVEGAAASKNNPKSELMLLGVARASFEELLEDYADFLRQKSLGNWGKNDPRAVEVRGLAYGLDRTDRFDRTYMTDKTDRTDKSYKTYESYLGDPERAANAMITLINQTNFLLDRQIGAVKNQHEKSGAIQESHSHKLKRIFEERRKKEKENDEWIRGILNKKE